MEKRSSLFWLTVSDKPRKYNKIATKLNSNAFDLSNLKQTRFQHNIFGYELQDPASLNLNLT